ncbi:MAG: alpha/beta hydrolase, partial [Promicromonosporaceae bacterium]|nr:alpha/beta hydrolase [Promicromonosporaceae bacterium]
ASDKPPTGYDIPTRIRDVAAVIRSLGRKRAVVVGHGTGAETAWVMSTLPTGIAAGIVAVACPFPTRFGNGFLKTLTPRARRLYALAQVPWYPERFIRNPLVLHRFFADGRSGGYASVEENPFSKAVLAKYVEVIRIPFAAHNSIEALRWIARSAPIPDGRRYHRALRGETNIPVLQIQGGLDGFINIGGKSSEFEVFGAGERRFANFTSEWIDDGGHFLPEEHPERIAASLIEFLSRVSW